MCRYIVFISMLFCSIGGFSQKLQAWKLRCDNATDPLGVESKAPLLGWEILSDKRNVQQTSYRILVADNETLLDKNIGNVWDSKPVKSATSINVFYKGKKLIPAQKYYWASVQTLPS